MSYVEGYTNTNGAAAGMGLAGPQAGAFPLRAGARHNLVRLLQKTIINKGGYEGALIIYAGGVTGVLNRLTVLAVNHLGVDVPISEKNFESIVGKFSIDATQNVADVFEQYALVTAWEGAKIWKKVNTNGMQGTNYITTLRTGAFAGVPTSKATERYLQLSVKIDNKVYDFWIERSQIVIYDSREFILNMRSNTKTGFPKTNEDLAAIVATIV